MQKYASWLLAGLIFTAPITTQAAINFGNQNYAAPFAASSTQKVGSLVKDFSLNDINSSSSISAGIGIFGAIRNFFISIDSWLKVHAGINLFAILTTIGHWFVLTLEWILKALKAIL